jgi:hypothetical protein
MNTQEKTLHIDIPVKLTKVKVVFSIASLSFEGDLPGCLFHLQLIVNDISNWKATSQVVAVFHTNAGHVTLHDQAYNHDRNIATGNPYKKLVTDLMERGVPNKMCGGHKCWLPPEKRCDFVRRRHTRGFHLYSVVPDKRFTRQNRRCNPVLPFRASKST